MDLFSNITSDGVALTSAFIGGVFFMCVGVCAWNGIKNAINTYRKNNQVMATRNR